MSNDAVLQETANEVIASGDIKGKIYVDCSTVHPDTSVKIAEQISAAGGEFVAGMNPQALFINTTDMSQVPYSVLLQWPRPENSSSL